MLGAGLGIEDLLIDLLVCLLFDLLSELFTYLPAPQFTHRPAYVYISLYLLTYTFIWICSRMSYPGSARVCLSLDDLLTDMMLIIGSLISQPCMHTWRPYFLQFQLKSNSANWHRSHKRLILRAMAVDYILIYTTSFRPNKLGHHKCIIARIRTHHFHEILVERIYYVYIRIYNTGDMDWIATTARQSQGVPAVVLQLSTELSTMVSKLEVYLNSQLTVQDHEMAMWCVSCFFAAEATEHDQKYIRNSLHGVHAPTRR